MFIGSAATLSVGIVLAAFAVRSENQAENFLSLQQYDNPSSAALVSYNASIADRDRYRAAATASMVGASALLITGLFLHELDRPSLPASTRADVPSSSSSPASDAPRVSIAPAAPGSDVGASLRMHF